MRFYTMLEAAAAVKRGWWVVDYLHRAGHVPKPSTRVGNRAIYTDEDVDRLRQALEARAARRRENKLRLGNQGAT
jgi:hypothetical protein